MENSQRDRAQVYGNMEGTTQREDSQNIYTTFGFGPETQVFPGEENGRGVQEDDALRTKTSKPDKTNEVRAKSAGSKRTVTVTAEGLTVSLPPPTKRLKTSKDQQKKKPAKSTLAKTTAKYKDEESSSAFLWPAGAGGFDLNVGERSQVPRVSLVDTLIDNHRDATKTPLTLPLKIPLIRNTSTITNADISTPTKSPKLARFHDMEDVMETHGGSVLEKLSRVAMRAR